jgi:predicted GNAT superfamily acetyltransferase
MSDYIVRPFETIEEYRACVALQEETWGRGFSERVPPAILKVSQILGGVAAGAYDAHGALTGFVFGMTGVREGETVHWSDMLAVRPGVRDSGLGTRLKAYQREQVMARGVRKMFWTFDPLQSRNAHVNFAKLGIVVREYARDMYGQTDSPLHRGIGTDRFIALWLLDSARVEERLQRSLAATPRSADPRTPPAASDPEEALEGVAVVLDADERGAHPRPGEPHLDADDATVAARIPSEVAAILDADMELARAWRVATRATFERYLGAGWEVSELVRGPRTSTYLMTRTPTSHSAPERRTIGAR